MSRKKLTSALLSPLARAWAHARLRAALAYPAAESEYTEPAP